jgi:hypothetical protein
METAPTYQWVPTGSILDRALSTQKLGREPINLPGGRLAEVRYAPVATKFCDDAIVLCFAYFVRFGS